jgi:hypothetical protein
MTELDTLDKIAMYGGGGLVVLGVVGIGLLEIVAGAPHPVSTEGQIVHEALVPLGLRSGIILLGLFLWMSYAAIKVATAGPGSGGSRSAPAGATGDD